MPEHHRRGLRRLSFVGQRAAALAGSVAWLGACSAPALDAVVVPPIRIESSEEPAPVAVELAEPEPKLIDGACEERLAEATMLTDVSQGPDRDLFVGVLEARRAGDRVTSRRKLLELYHAHPSSPLVPYAFIQLGEIFVEEGESDPTKRGIALAAFREALKYPYPKHEPFFLASLRVADLQRAEGAHSDAMVSYRNVLGATRSHPEAPCMVSLGARARTGLVLSYAQVGRPGPALVFFSSGGANPNEALQMVVALVGAYVEADKMSAAEGLARDIMSRERAKAACPALKAMVKKHHIQVALSPCD